MQIERHAKGARLVQGGAVLSEILNAPGATNSVFDILAAAIALHPSESPRVALLGFAGGGLVAPLRALGNRARLEACDLDPTGWTIFDELSKDWRGDVQMETEDAVSWLRRDRSRFDVVIEDLSCLGEDGEETKPAISVTALPERIARRVSTTHGIVATNLLPVPGVSWRALQAQVASPWPRAVLVELDEWENRILFAGPGVPSARATARRLGASLEHIESSLSNKGSKTGSHKLSNKFRARELRDR